MKEECFLSFDWGIGAPSACALVWPNPPDAPVGSLYVIDELYVCDRTMGGQRNWSKGVYLDNRGVNPCEIQTIADNAIFASTGSEKGSVAAEFKHCGVVFRPAQKMQHRSAEGLSIVRSAMAATGRSPDSPWLMWSQHCEAWEATVPVLINHLRDTNDCVDEKPDHILDAVRMALMWWRAKYRIGKSTFRVW